MAIDVQSMYIQVIDSLLEIGVVLPPGRGTLDSLYNESTKIKKRFQRSQELPVLHCMQFNNHRLSNLPKCHCQLLFLKLS